MAHITVRVPCCPHCRKQLPSAPRDLNAAVGGTFYGRQYATCPRCRNIYRQPSTIEAACALTGDSRVKWYLSTPRLLAGVCLLGTLPAVAWAMAQGMEQWQMLLVGILGCLATLAAASGVLGVLTVPLRQGHMRRVLASSRRRVQEDDTYLATLCIGAGWSTQDMVLLALHKSAAKDWLTRRFRQDETLDLQALRTHLTGLAA